MPPLCDSDAQQMHTMRGATWKMLKASTPVKVRCMGDAVPGLLVNSSRQRPLICSDAVGACAAALMSA